MSDNTREFEGYSTHQKLKDWFDELLQTLQLHADREQANTKVTLTITITALPQGNAPDEQEAEPA